MIAGADFGRYLLSVGGVVLLFLVASLWTFYAHPSRKHARVSLIVAIVFTALSMYGPQVLVARLIVGSLKPFQAGNAAAGRRTAIVILGSGSTMVEDWEGGTVSVADRAALSRVLEATRIFRMVNPAVVIASGGDPHPERGNTPTGETMRDALVNLGVPADRIMIETESRTTREEAVVVARILAAQQVEQVVLVTSETHMRRSLSTFRGIGVAAIPGIALEYPRGQSTLTELIMPSEDGLSFAAANAHELLGFAYYWLRGWAK